ncbi:hypothetical protein CH063_03331 [Colletotrichum higginsianum]|uniref:Uncharacterized protein n=1 Tax=Colletotrichum higginsianum (strain IMI 349063) TaxID=759273 RepID=H1VW07_COLHI|nr:hypothetical protein CH63R_09584 [Colletotrichum higginsianum IMI 349063]OBR08063.1 hypothetical protein CH63R_09584 [Colletotrichum higginsianum IMI 349063]CCF44418.1 hypothetical protein CH063_03331 [Colletotrichum higginsianum]
MTLARKLETAYQFETYTHSDCKTISDVIIHLRYTAKDGGDTLRSAVEESLDTSIKDAAKNTQTALFDLKNDAPDSWHMLLSSQSERAVAQMRGLKSRLPYLARSQGIKVTSVKMYAGGQDLKEASISLSSTKEQAFGPSAVTLKYADDLGRLEVFTDSANGSGNLDFVLTDQWYIAVEGQVQGDGQKLAPE